MKVLVYKTNLMRTSALRSCCITTQQGPTRNLGSCTWHQEEASAAFGCQLRAPSPRASPRDLTHAGRGRVPEPHSWKALWTVYPKQSTHDCAVSRPAECCSPALTPWWDGHTVLGTAELFGGKKKAQLIFTFSAATTYEAVIQHPTNEWMNKRKQQRPH